MQRTMLDVEAMEQLINRLRNIAAAYPEDIFPPLTDQERKQLPRGFIDRISGAMGRFHAPRFTEAADALQSMVDLISMECALPQRAHKQPLTHEAITFRVQLMRARDQLLRYSSEDPIAAEITKLVGPA